MNEVCGSWIRTEIHVRQNTRWKQFVTATSAKAYGSQRPVHSRPFHLQVRVTGVTIVLPHVSVKRPWGVNSPETGKVRELNEPFADPATSGSWLSTHLKKIQ